MCLPALSPIVPRRPLILALACAAALVVVGVLHSGQAQAQTAQFVRTDAGAAAPQQVARSEGRSKKLGVVLGPCLAGSDGDLPCFYLGADLTFYRSNTRFGFEPAPAGPAAPRYFRRAGTSGAGGRGTIAYDTDIWSDPECPPCRDALAKASVSEHTDVLMRHSGTVLALVDAVYLLAVGERGTFGIEPFIGGGAGYLVERDDEDFLFRNAAGNGYDGPRPSQTEVAVTSVNPLPVVTYGAEITLPSLLLRDLALRVQLRALTLFTDGVTYTAYTPEGPVDFDEEDGTLTRVKVLFGLAARF